MENNSEYRQELLAQLANMANTATNCVKASKFDIF